MAEYYLVSQLPSLDGLSDSMPLPITEERFLELCSRLLNKKAQSEIKELTLIPPPGPQKARSPLLQAWYDGERILRLVLAKVRAQKLGKTFALENVNLPAELVRVANTAVEMESPLEAEKFLSDYRLQLLESLRPMDTFSEDYVFYYGLKLKLILRIRQFNTQLGDAAYKNIYNSILNGDRLEAI